MNVLSEKRGIVTVEYLRAALCISIMMFHAAIPWTQLLWAGVQAFFVLSAFFVVLKLYNSEHHTISIGTLFKKRIGRLYLPYLAVVALGVLFALLKREGVMSIVADTAFHLFGLQNFEWIYTGYHSAIQPMTAHTWTLGIEIWLYLIFLFLLKYVPVSGRKPITACETSSEHARACSARSNMFVRSLVLIAVSCVAYRFILISLGADRNWVALRRLLT